MKKIFYGYPLFIANIKCEMNERTETREVAWNCRGQTVALVSFLDAISKESVAV
jgi:hypothetical protein